MTLGTDGTLTNERVLTAGSGVSVTDGGAGSTVTVAASPSALPGYEFGYDQITSSVTVTATAEASGTTVITCAAHTFDGSPVFAHFYTDECVVGAGANNFLCVMLFEGATEIGRLGQKFTASAQLSSDMNGWLRFTPSAGSHTYTVTAFRGGANGTIQAAAGGTAAYPPAFVRFVKI